MQADTDLCPNPVTPNACNHISHADRGAVVGGVGEGVTVRDGVVVTTVPVARVRAILRAPLLRVHGAVLTNRYAVLREQISVEELAGLRRAIGWGVGKVVCALIGACGGTESCVERATLEDLETHVSIGIVAVKRGIDGRVSEIGRLRVALSGL